MILLENRGVVKITGADRVDFLQGLITNDVKKLSESNLVFTAMLTPQGKYLYDFILHQIGDAIFIDIEKDKIETLVKKLRMFKLRSDVVVEDVSASYFVYSSDEKGLSDPRTPKLGKRFISQEKLQTTATIADYNKKRIALGVPENGDLQADKSFIMQNSFEELNAVDFKKGCYVGQEVTARTKYKNGVRKRLYRIEASSELPTGAAITAGEKEVGEVRSVAGNFAIAQCDIEEVEKANNFNAAGVEVKILPLAI